MSFLSKAALTSLLSLPISLDAAASRPAEAGLARLEAGLREVKSTLPSLQAELRSVIDKAKAAGEGTPRHTMMLSLLAESWKLYEETSRTLLLSTADEAGEDAPLMEAHRQLRADCKALLKGKTPAARRAPKAATSYISGLPPAALAALVKAVASSDATTCNGKK